MVAVLLIGCAPPHVDDVQSPSNGLSSAQDSAASVDVVDASITDAFDASPTIDAGPQCTGGPIVKVRLDVESGVGRITMGEKRFRLFSLSNPYSCRQRDLDAGADGISVFCMGDDRGTSMSATRHGDTLIIEGVDYERHETHVRVPLAPCASVQFTIGELGVRM